MRKRRKQKLTLRLKEKRRKTKKFIFFVAGLLLLFLIALQTPNIIGLAKDTKAFVLSAMKVKDILIHCTDSVLKEEIQRKISVQTGTAFNCVKTQSLEKEILHFFPQVKKVKVNTNCVTGKIVIDVSLRQPIAKVFIGGKEKLMDIDGYLYLQSDSTVDTHVNKSLSLPLTPTLSRKGRGELIPIYIKDNFTDKKMPYEVVELVKQIEIYINRFTHKPVSFYYVHANKHLSIILDDGSIVDWGDFEYTKEKIERIRQGFEEISSKLKGPYNINLKFFRDGRMLFSPLTVSVTKDTELNKKPNKEIE